MLALALTLTILLNTFAPSLAVTFQVHFVTHSMGARILFAAFERLTPQLATLEEQAQGLADKVSRGVC